MIRTLTNATVLVTGATGFIASHLCEELLAMGNRIIAVDNYSQSKADSLSFLRDNQNLTLIKADCNSFDEMQAVFQKYSIEYVFHYAATVGVKRTTENPLAVLNDIEGIKHILSLSKEYKIKKVVFASSSEVYGEPVEIPEKEDGILNAKIPYAQVKLIGESYCQAYTRFLNLPTVSLRFFNVFGPRQESSEYGFVVGIFMRQILEDKAPTVVNDGRMTRNFVYVKDNVHAAIMTLLTEKVDGQVINIGTGKSISVLELAKKIIKISEKDLDVTFIPPRNDHEILHREPDITKQQQLIGYTPHYSLDEGLRLTYEWYKSVLHQK